MKAEKTDFETALKSLEEIAEKLENPETTLEESIALFEEGMEKSAECSAILNEAKQKIVLLTDAKKELNSND